MRFAAADETKRDERPTARFYIENVKISLHPGETIRFEFFRDTDEGYDASEFTYYYCPAAGVVYLAIVRTAEDCDGPLYSRRELTCTAYDIATQDDRYPTWERVPLC